MLKGIDIEIYKNISSEMNVAEIYIGHILYDFDFSIAQYAATCTEAFPFNAFDKVICELLKVEDELSFNEIGDILGLNVYSSENPKRILDLAEKEILLEALQSLESEEFKMIEGGDINFSRCRLTKIGREYAEKKSKFKIIDNKPFSIFFDHTTGNNLLAKQNFEFTDGKRSEKYFEIESIDEPALKEIAIVQIPEIYNPSRQYSFTNPVLQRHKCFSVTYPVGLSYNIRTKDYRLYCFDTNNKRIHNDFTNWLNSNKEIKQEIIAKTKSLIEPSSKAVIEFDKINDQILSYPENVKISDYENILVQSEFIDEPFAYTHLGGFIGSKDEVQLYLCMPFVNETVVHQINALVQKSENPNSKYFIVFPMELSEKYQAFYKQLKTISSDSSNIYIIQKPVINFSLCCKKTVDSFYLDMTWSSFEGVGKAFVIRKPWDSRAIKIEEMLLTNFSNEYSLVLCNLVNQTINNSIEKPVTKSQLEELASYEFKLKPFRGIGEQSSTVNLTLSLITQFRHERITLLDQRISNQLSVIENKLKAISDESNFKIIQKEFEVIRSEILFNESDVYKQSEKLLQIIANKKEEFAETKRVYSFIIDTNVFIKDPIIISKIASKNKVIIAGKVLDELDGFKANSQLKEVASKSIREIFADKNKNIHRAKANE